MNHAIGGYFELELPQRDEYYQDAIRLNSGRHALEYILKAKQYKKLILPYYTCGAILESINRLNISYEFYSIDEAFQPLFDFQLIEDHTAFVYTNYFGLCENVVDDVSSKCRNLIIDNAQAFFSKQIDGIDTFNSPRKFFGLADGGYLFTNIHLEEELKVDSSFNRFEHLLGRIDDNAEKHYKTFLQGNKLMSSQSIKKMSKLTQRLLASIDYEAVKDRRRSNFTYLHQFLSSSNQLAWDLNNAIPMVYPYLVQDGKRLKKKLIENKIFVATYWSDVKNWSTPESFEMHLVNNLIALPIDQRYGIKEMKKILEIIQQHDLS